MDGDLIIDKGFTVLNNFKPGAAADGGGEDKNPIPRYPFASYTKAVKMPSSDDGTSHRSSFLNDCSLVFTARTKEDSEGYSTGSTFFLPCLMKPRCALEALAREIFNAHVNSLPELEEHSCDSDSAKKNGESKKKKRLLYDPDRSGAEWWTLVLDTPSDASDKHKEDSDDAEEDDDEEDDEVGIHFDADYGLEEQLPDYHIHPRVATVTYLSDAGVPTLILDKTSPPPSDKEKSSLNGNVNKAWLSHPSFGKHVAFDGRFLHGAPGEYFPSVAIKSNDTSEPKAKKLKVDENTSLSALCHGKRVTFLVNIWLNHCPIESEPLDDEIVEKLATPWEDIYMQEDNGGGKSNLKEGDPIIPPFEWNIKNINETDSLNKTATLEMASGNSGPAGVEDVVICNRHVDIMFGASMEDFHKVSRLAAEGGRSLAIDMKDGVFTLNVGKEASSDEEEEDES